MPPHNLPEPKQNGSRGAAQDESHGENSEPETGYANVGTGSEADPSSRNQPQPQKEKENQRWLELARKYKPVIEVLGVLVVIAYTLAAFWQAREAKRSADATMVAAQAAKDAAVDSQDANANTQAAIKQNKVQFSKTLDQMREQTSQQKRSADSAAGQLDESRNSLQLDQRAWVGLDSITNPVVTVGNNVSFQISFRNSGRTPANGVSIQAGLQSFPGPPQPLDPLLISRIGKTKVALDLSGVVFTVVGGSRPVIVPGAGEVTILTSRDPLTIMVYQQLASAFAQTLYVWGNVKYRDIFGRAHTTRFCQWWNPPDSGLKNPNSDPMRYCADHNSMN